MDSGSEDERALHYLIDSFEDYDTEKALNAIRIGMNFKLAAQIFTLRVQTCLRVMANTTKPSSFERAKYSTKFARIHEGIATTLL